MLRTTREAGRERAEPIEYTLENESQGLHSRLLHCILVSCVALINPASSACPLVIITAFGTPVGVARSRCPAFRGGTRAGPRSRCGAGSSALPYCLPPLSRFICTLRSRELYD